MMAAKAGFSFFPSASHALRRVLTCGGLCVGHDCARWGEMNQMGCTLAPPGEYVASICVAATMRPVAMLIVATCLWPLPRLHCIDFWTTFGRMQPDQSQLLLDPRFASLYQY